MKIYVDGLERSGNVFLSGAIAYTLNIDVISQRDHSLNIFKNREPESIFIVPLRDALPSIVSGRLYRKYSFENNLINDKTKGIYASESDVIQRYKDYTDYLLDNEDLFIAPFHEFTKDHDVVINVIAKTYGLTPLYRFTAEEIIEKVGQPPVVNNPYMGNFPRNEAPQKEAVLERILFYHKDKVDAIQENIDKLYERYYEKAES